MSPKLLAVAERARRDPHAPLRSLAHLIDEAALERAYQRLRSSAAPGIDGVTKDEYGRNLYQNLQQLHQRLKQQRYRHQPLRRAYLPKPDGRKRPIGDRHRGGQDRAGGPRRGTGSGV